MQHDWTHVERPGESHTALDGKKIHRDGDPSPILDSAKLHYCYSNVIDAAFSAPVLLCLSGAPLLSGCRLVPCPVVLLLGFPFACLSLVDLACFLCLLPLPCSHSGTNEWRCI